MSDYIKEFSPQIKALGPNEDLDKLEAQFKERGVKFDGETSASRVFDFVASDSSVDRMGDIIDVNGWDLKNFKRNPVILYNHNHYAGPIGISLDEQIKTEQLQMRIYIHDKTEKARETYDLIDAGMMRMSSVGFQAIETRNLDAEEKQKLGMGPYGIYFARQELHELSVVTVPANPNAAKKSFEQFGRNFDQNIFERIMHFFKENGVLETAKELKSINDRFDSLEEKLLKFVDRELVAKKQEKEKEESYSEEDLNKLFDSLKS